MIKKHFAKIFLICLLLVVVITKSSKASANNPNKDAGRLLYVEVFLEGLYNHSTQNLNIAHSYIDGEIVPAFGNEVSDVIIIALHEAGDYTEHNWGDLLRFETMVYLDCNGSAVINLPDEVNGVILSEAYWLSINHRNHIETVYQTPLDLSEAGPFYCDFITGDISGNTALGNNQKYFGQINRNESTIHAYGLYVGDINGDGKINITDRSLLNYNLSIGIRGHIPEDLNGDGVITISDRSILEKNLYLFIESVTPENKGLYNP